jgi:nucleotide-binding universal stress UspA family protein
MDEKTEHVVVGYDGSADAELAVEWAARQARRHNHALTVLSVVNDDEWILEYWRREAVLHGGKIVAKEGAERARAAAPGLNVTSMTKVGPAAACLVEASRDAALVVVGSRGRGTLINLAIGSVAAAVASHASCPVVVVRGSGDIVVGPNYPVVVGVDGSPPSRAALAFAAAQAREASAPLTVVCARNVLAGEGWNDAYVGVAVALDEGTMRADERRVAQETLDAAVDWVRWNHPDVAVTALMPEGPPAVELVRVGDDAGLIVVGTRGRGAFASLLLGSVSHAVVHAATRPVAVVRGEFTAKAHEEASDTAEAADAQPLAPA